MITEFPVFAPLTASTAREAANLARDYDAYASVNPVSLWAWNRGYPGGVSQLYGNLVIRWKDPTGGLPYLSFVPRNAFRQTVSTLLDYASRQKLSPCLRAIPATRLKVQPYTGGEFRISDDRDTFEYLLSVDDWARLQGAGFRNRRNTINTLERRLDISIRMLSLDDKGTREDIDQLCTRWAKQRGLANAQFLPEQTAIRNLFDYVPSSGIFVVGAHVDNTLAGFSINEFQDNGVGIGHFAKADYTFPGLYTYLLHHACLHLQERGLESLNIEEDLGDPGLRQAKLLLKPVKLLEKVRICRS